MRRMHHSNNKVIFSMVTCICYHSRKSRKYSFVEGRGRYGYNSEDLLDMKDVSMYQFDITEDGHTRLKTLVTTNFGFVVPTFNHAIEKIVQEVLEFQGSDE